MFFSGFDKQDEHDQVFDENDLNINLDITQKLTQSDIGNNHIRSRLGRQIQKQKSKDSG